MLVKGEYPVLVEGSRNLLNNQTSLQLTRHLHKHDGTHICDLLRGELWNGRSQSFLHNYYERPNNISYHVHEETTER